MSETTTTPSSATMAEATTEAQKVDIASPPSEAVVTHGDENHFSGVAVRANKEQVILRFEPKALEERRKTEELNERIRKYGKAF